MINYIEKEGNIIIACPYSSDISYNKGFCERLKEVELARPWFVSSSIITNG